MGYVKVGDVQGNPVSNLGDVHAAWDSYQHALQLVTEVFQDS
jgi:hypothetical protein